MAFMSGKSSAEVVGERRLQGQSQQRWELAAGDRGECLAVCCASSLCESHSSESASVGRLEFSSEDEEEKGEEMMTMMVMIGQCCWWQ